MTKIQLRKFEHLIGFIKQFLNHGTLTLVSRESLKNYAK